MNTHKEERIITVVSNVLATLLVLCAIAWIVGCISGLQGVI
jgi:hypothetical protein